MTSLPPLETGHDVKTASYGIPVRQLQLSTDRSLCYVALSDMDSETAERFTGYIAPCACPTVEGEEAFYLHDWERWNRAVAP